MPKRAAKGRRSSSAPARAGSRGTTTSTATSSARRAPRLNDLAEGLARIHARWDELNPPPTRKIPVMIGGKGEQKTLRLVARHADIWHSFVRPEELPHKLEVIEKWAERRGATRRRSSSRTSCSGADEDVADELFDGGARLFTLGFPGPDFDYDLRALVARVARREERRSPAR